MTRIISITKLDRKCSRTWITITRRVIPDIVCARRDSVRRSVLRETYEAFDLGVAFVWNTEVLRGGRIHSISKFPEILLVDARL